jgi:hypothetical protein
MILMGQRWGNRLNLTKRQMPAALARERGKATELPGIISGRHRHDLEGPSASRIRGISRCVVQWAFDSASRPCPHAAMWGVSYSPLR